MFPSAGLFRDVSCPYYIFGLCERPYCHFKHSKHDEVKEKKASRSTSLIEAPAANNEEKYQLPTSSLQRTLNEVEDRIKNEKQKSNSSNVNSKTGKAAAGTPEYNPTPLQELKRQRIEGKLGRSKYDLALLNEPASTQEYDPASNFSTKDVPAYAQPILGYGKRTSRDDAEDNEYDPMAKIPNFVSVEYIPSVIEPPDVSDDEPLGEKEDWFSDSDSESNKKDKLKKSQPFKSDDSVLKNGEKKESEASLPLEFTADGFIKVQPVKSKLDSKKDGIKDKVKKSPEVSNIFNIFNSLTGDDTKNNTKAKSDSEKKRSKNHDASSSISSAKKGKESSNSHSKHSSSSDSKGGKSSSDSSLKRKHSDTKNGHKEEKGNSSEKRSRTESKSADSRHRTDRHSSSGHSDKSSSDRHRSTHKESKSEQPGSSHSHRRSSSESSSSKSKHGKHNEKSKHTIVNLNVDLFGADSDNEKDNDKVENDAIDDDFDEFEDFDKYFPQEDPYDECLKIYNEVSAKGPSSSGTSKKSKTPNKSSTSMSIQEAAQNKKRVALKKGSQESKHAPKVERTAPKPSPAQVMMNRYKMMQQRAFELQEAEKHKIKEKLAEQKKAGFHTSKETPKVPPTMQLKLTKKNPLNPMRAAKTATAGRETKKTAAITATKGSKRQAHVPTVPVEKLKRPVVDVCASAKVGANVRQRYLNLLIDECIKLCRGEKEAFRKGKAEEESVYERCNNKKIYLNLIVIAIKRLRTEIAQKSAKPSTSSSSKRTPTKLSHQAILGGAMASKSTFTLNRSGGAVKLQTEDFKGSDLYQRLSPYILNEQKLKENNFPRSHPETGGVAVFFGESKTSNKGSTKGYEKLCTRCGKVFEVYPNGKYAKREECIYHWGKAWQKKIAGSMEARYTCCSGDLTAQGCQVAKAHVHDTNKTEIFTGYMKTIPCSPPPDGNYRVYALDCEMVYTNLGIELARVTVVDADQEVVYESFVKPDKSVIDYNTRFSGITAEDMESVTTSLRDVQAVLLSLFSDKTILMGHSLESDLIALKLIHSTVVDTSVVFPHRLGPPKKRALRTLMVEFLKKIIQDDVAGHDSMEDAVSCVQLMQWKLKEDARKEGRRLLV